jgi:hypothetical protein
MTEEQLAELIAAACAATQPNTRERRKALSAIRWRLVHQRTGLYAGLSGIEAALVPADDAQTFTGCDNEALKLAYWQRALGVPLELEVLP